jgi:hypothetical protein
MREQAWKSVFEQPAKPGRPLSSKYLDSFVSQRHPPCSFIAASALRAVSRRKPDVLLEVHLLSAAQNWPGSAHADAESDGKRQLGYSQVRKQGSATRVESS